MSFTYKNRVALYLPFIMIAALFLTISLSGSLLFSLFSLFLDTVTGSGFPPFLGIIWFAFVTPEEFAYYRQLTCLPIIGEFFRCHLATIDGIASAFCVKTTHIAHELVENIIHVVKVVVHMSTSFLTDVLVFS